VALAQQTYSQDFPTLVSLIRLRKAGQVLIGRTFLLPQLAEFINYVGVRLVSHAAMLKISK
jgi:hypothetical protein